MSTDTELAGMALLEKAGAVVAALESVDEAAVPDIADRVGEPVSSTYRLLASLVAIGWVDAGSRRGVFRLGLKFARIGSLLEDRLSVSDACRPQLEWLREATEATAFLCLLRDDAAVCVDRREGRDVRSLAMRLGDSLPLHRGAAPLALFASLPDGERDAVLARLAERRRRGEDVPARRTLLAVLETVRARGYSVSDGDVTPGIAAVGAPVFNHRGEIEGAISVSGLRHRILESDVDVRSLTVHAAAAASRALGHVAEQPAS